MHAALPVVEDALEFEEIERRPGPLVAIGVIHLEVVEVEHHGELGAVQRAIALAVLRLVEDISPPSWPHRGEHVAADVLQEFVDARPVGVEATAVAAVIVRALIMEMRLMTSRRKPSTPSSPRSG